MNKVLMWSLIASGALIIIVVLVISGSNVANLSSYKMMADGSKVTEYEKWADTPEPSMMEASRHTTGDLAWVDDSINGYFYEAGEKSKPEETPDPQNNAETGKSDNNTQTNAKNRRKKIYTAELLYHVKDYDTGIAKAKSLMSDYQGYISLQTNTRLIVRIPAEYFDPFVEALKTIGKRISENIKALEVTEQYNDLKIKIDALEKSIADWEAKRKTVKTDAAMIEIDKIIDKKQQELAIYLGKMRYLVDQISFSTVTIDFTMDPTPPPTAPRHRFNVPYNWMRYLDVENLLGDHSYQDDYED